MIDFFNTLLYPIKLGEAWVMYGWHWLFDKIGLNGDLAGWAWAMSIVGLTVVVRLLLIPLFVRQIHSSRRMQLIQPEMQKIQKKYKGKTDPASRQAMTQETMALYRESGTNPFASCLPILLQSPVFFALYRVLQNIASDHPHAIGPFSLDLIAQADQATIFGARLSDKFIGAETTSTKIVAAVLIVLMSLSTFTTQRQLMQKNMPAAALDNPFAKQQKMLMYILPFFFFITGPNFPIGVLIYWLTTNVWSMGQQFYVIRRMPAPGSQAEIELMARRERKKTHGKDAPPPEPEPEPTPPTVAGQRQQPKRNQPKAKRAAKPPGSSGPPSKGAAPKGSSSGSSGTSGGSPGGSRPPGKGRPKAPDDESGSGTSGSARAG